MLRPLTAGSHPFSNCQVREVKLIFRECFCILRKDGIFLGTMILASIMCLTMQRNRSMGSWKPVSF